LGRSTITKIAKLFKVSLMPDLKLKQLQYEAAVWRRLLESMIDENIYHKERLAEILKDRFNFNLLEDIENFQNRFIQQDELFRLIKTHIVKMDKLLIDENFDQEQAYEKMKSVRSDTIDAEKQFIQLKLEFNSYLGDNL